MSGIRVVRNRLVIGELGGVQALETDEQQTIGAGLVVRSVGHQGGPIPGVPFDDGRAVLSNDAGRVIDPDTGKTVTGVYSAGWIKRGPSGVIGTNESWGAETVASHRR